MMDKCFFTYFDIVTMEALGTKRLSKVCGVNDDGGMVFLRARLLDHDEVVALNPFLNGEKICIG